MKRILGAMLVLLLLSGCSTKVPTRKIAPQAEQAGPAATGPSIVRVLSVQGDPTLDVLISAYYGRYANARVDKVSVSGGTSMAEAFRQKLTDGAVDVVPLVGGANVWIAEMMKGNALAPLDPYIQKSKFDLKPYGGLVEQLRMGGQLYELPYIANAPVIAYNPELFAAAGMPQPKEGWTWDQFREAARKLTRGDGEGKVWGFAYPVADPLVQQWFYGRSDNWRFDEKVLREGMQFFSTLVFTDRAVMPSARMDGTNIQFREEFWQGKAAMTLEYAGFGSAMFRNSKVKPAYAPFPVHPGEKPAAVLSPYTLAIAANGRDLDAAWQFISFACGPEGAAALAKAGYLPMYNTAEIRQLYGGKQPPPPAGWEALFGVNWKVAPRTGDPLYALDVRAGTLLNQVLSGTKDWENAVAEYLREAESLKPQKK